MVLMALWTVLPGCGQTGDLLLTDTRQQKWLHHIKDGLASPSLGWCHKQACGQRPHGRSCQHRLKVAPGQQPAGSQGTQL